MLPLTELQRDLVRHAHGRLRGVAACPEPVEREVYRHWEHELLDEGPIGSQMSFQATFREVNVVVRTMRDAVELLFFPYTRAGDRRTWVHVRLDRASHEALRQAGWIASNTATVRDVASLDRALDALVAARGRLYRWRDLPPELEVPQLSYVEWVLFADTIDGEDEERGRRYLRVRRHGEPSRIQMPRGGTAERVLAFWPSMPSEPWGPT